MSLVPVFILPVYAVALMWILLDVQPGKIPPQRKKIAIAFALGTIIVNVAVFLLFGRTAYARVYALIMHVPVLIAFSIVSPYRGWKVVFAFLTAFVSCAVPVIVDSVARLFGETGPWTELAIFAATCALMLLVAAKGFRNLVAYALKHGEPGDFARFSLIPLTYELYAFSTRGSFSITDLPAGLNARLVPLVLTVLSYYLVFRVFKNTREKQVLLQEQQAAAAQLDQAKLELSRLRETTAQTAAYRHDMRHHLALVSNLVAEGNAEKLKEYLAEIESDLDDITPQRFCNDETTNLILSSFSAKAHHFGVSMQITASLSRHVPLSDTEWCALLSNLLENAVTACANVHDGRNREVRLAITSADDRTLLVLVENPCCKAVTMENDRPTTSEQGHGFGIKSVDAIVGKHGGMSLYETVGGAFVARIAIPLEQQPA